MFDSWGGLKSIKSHATGFFRLEKIADRHFLITPDGHGYRALGLNHFHNMTSKDYDETIEQIKSWGFNAGCYQGPRWMWTRYPYTKGINLVPVCVWKSDSEFAFQDVFDEDVLAAMAESVRKIVEPQRNNQMLIGYFWTDIPVWSRTDRGGWISFYKSLPEDSAGGTIWNQWKNDHPDADESEFLTVIAKQLYAKGHEFLRRYDSNHLIFGDRYHEVDIPESIVREALPYIDAIAIQPTSRQFNYQFFDDLYDQYQLPIYIADHVSSFATDTHPVTMGQAADDPDTYGDYYRRYVTAAISRPYMIGFNKCQYQDQPTPKLLKQGMIRVDETPYPIIEHVQAANFEALDLGYSGTEATARQVAKQAASHDNMMTGEPLVITSPVDKASFDTTDSITISANADLERLGGRHVRFYYLDQKWQLIDKDDVAPHQVEWKNPPPGDWDIYVAVHDANWKIVAKSHVSVSVEPHVE